MVFSGTRCPGMPPRSNPPWPGSMTTVIDDRPSPDSETVAVVVDLAAATVLSAGAGAGVDVIPEVSGRGRAGKASSDNALTRNPAKTAEWQRRRNIMLVVGRPFRKF